MDDLFADPLRQLLNDICTPQVVRAIEAGESARLLWEKLEESGFADALLSEQRGGAGLSLRDAFPLLELCGTFAMPVPLAQTMLARAALAQAGAPIPSGSITFCEGRLLADGRVICSAVPYGRVAQWVLVQHANGSLLLSACEAESSSAIFPLDASLEWPATAAQEHCIAGESDVRTLEGCVYAILLSGAMISVFKRTLEHANERIQFGRPIGKFQAIQHQLSVISEQVLSARMAAQIGCHGERALPDRMCVAIAKARTSEAATEVAALAHSIHGAIGFTEELDLQLFTRRLRAWRLAGGSESYWHRELGAALVDRRDGSLLDVIREILD